MALAEGTVLWTPPRERAAASELARYLRWLAERQAGCASTTTRRCIAGRSSGSRTSGRRCGNSSGSGRRCRTRACSTSAGCPGAKWFEGARLNYAEHAFRNASARYPAILARSEARPAHGGVVGGARAAGRCDRRRPARARRESRATASCRTCPTFPRPSPRSSRAASVGAIWSSCSPDMGSGAVLDRFRQIEPKVLFAVDGYRYGGQATSTAGRCSREIVGAAADARARGVPAVSRPGWPRLPGVPRPTGRACSRGRAARVRAGALRPSAVDRLLVRDDRRAEGDRARPRRHRDRAPEDAAAAPGHAARRPLLLDVEHRLDRVEPAGERAARRLHDRDASTATRRGPTRARSGGSSARRAPTTSAAARRSSARAMKAGVEPAQIADLSRRSMHQHDRLAADASTPSSGSTTHVKRDLWLASISGGTDIACGFVAGCPLLPVTAGEMQARCLGVAVEAFDEAGRPRIGEVGELVVTEPMPTMPLYFWNDPGERRYRESYFETLPRQVAPRRLDPLHRARHERDLRALRHHDQPLRHPHGDRGDLPRRRGAARGARQPGGRPRVPRPEVVPAAVRRAAARLRARRRAQGSASRTAIRTVASARHVPDEIYAIAEVPRTLTGKKMELPVRKLLLGVPVEKVASADAMANPRSLAFFAGLARTLNEA